MSEMRETAALHRTPAVRRLLADMAIPPHEGCTIPLPFIQGPARDALALAILRWLADPEQTAGRVLRSARGGAW